MFDLSIMVAPSAPGTPAPDSCPKPNNPLAMPVKPYVSYAWPKDIPGSCGTLGINVLTFLIWEKSTP